MNDPLAEVQVHGGLWSTADCARDISRLITRDFIRSRGNDVSKPRLMDRNLIINVHWKRIMFLKWFEIIFLYLKGICGLEFVSREAYIFVGEVTSLFHPVDTFLYEVWTAATV